MSYLRPTEELEVIDVIKNSQFIANTAIVESRAEGLAFVQAIKAQHPNANHSCHCFIAGAPEDAATWSYSDDGEPKGTAGQPMFQVLKHSGIGNLCVVVTRYFGGIKLGTGGIARAYSSLVKQALAATPTVHVERKAHFTLDIPFDLTGFVEQALTRTPQVGVLARDWHSEGQRLCLSIEVPSVESFNDALSAYAHRLALKPK
ncbi:MAG: IMPACT family protein [Pseudomonadales bacterium]